MSDSWWRDKTETSTVSGKSRKLILTLGLLALLAAGLFFILRSGPKGTDQEQILAVLAEGERAAEEKNIPALMRHVSKEYKDDLPLNKDRLRFLTAQALREYNAVFITMNNVSVEPQGETANVTAEVTVEGQDKKTNQTARNTMSLWFKFKKEQGHRFLVIPTTYWRVVESGGSGMSLDSSFF